MSIAIGVARYKDGTITYTVFDMSSYPYVRYGTYTNAGEAKVRAMELRDDLDTAT